MPRIPRYTAKEVPSGISPAAPISMRAGVTGAEQLGAGLQRLGKGIEDIADPLAKIELEFQRRLNEINVEELKVQRDKILEDALNGIASNGNPDEHGGIMEAASKAVRKLKARSPNAQHAYDVDTIAAIGRYEIAARRRSRAQIEQNLYDSIDLQMSHALTTLNSEEYRKAIDRGVDANRWNAFQAEQLRDDMAYQFVRQDIVSLAEHDKQAALEMASSIKDEITGLDGRKVMLTPQQITSINAIEDDIRADIGKAYEQGEVQAYKDMVVNKTLGGQADLDARLMRDEIRPSVHAAYTKALEIEALDRTESTFAYLWQQGRLREHHVRQAVALGRMSPERGDSWLRRIQPEASFNNATYSEVLEKIRQVKTDSGQYPIVKDKLLDPNVVTELGGTWTRLRDDLESAYEESLKPKDEEIGPHVARSHRSIDQWWDKQNIPFSADVVNDREAMHTYIDKKAKEGVGPDEMRKIVDDLLTETVIPGRSWFNWLWSQKRWTDTVAKRARWAPLEFVFSPVSAGVQIKRHFTQRPEAVDVELPPSFDEFIRVRQELKLKYGAKSKEARNYHDKYIGIFEKEIEEEGE